VMSVQTNNATLITTVMAIIICRRIITILLDKLLPLIVNAKGTARKAGLGYCQRPNE
jgi:hypothetical protein